MKIGAGFQTIMFSIRNLKGCIVGIIDGRFLSVTPLRLGYVPQYTY
jgi:hypothetical protein